MMKGIKTRNWKKKMFGVPFEDAYRIDSEEVIMAVANGITRDCKNGKDLRNDIWGIKDAILHYPQVSPAADASSIFCDASIGYVIFPERQNCQGILNAFESANEKIRKFQELQIPEIDYLANDFPGCTAALAVINPEGNTLSYGYICNSGIAIFNKNGGLKFKTPNEGPNEGRVGRELEVIVQKNGGWHNPEARKLIRSQYRNNPHKNLSFGVLTGEPEAMTYVKTGEQSLEKGDHVFVYTPGLVNGIFSEETHTKLRRGDIEGARAMATNYVGSEGVLVHFTKE